jgi:hypothetical protein
VPRRSFAIDRQLKDSWDTEVADDAETRAARRQVVNAANLFRRAKLNQSAFRSRNTAFLSALEHCSRASAIAGRLGDFAIICVLRRCRRDHVRLRSIAERTDKDISLHGTDDPMRRNCKTLHRSPAVRAHYFGIDFGGM